ncbi:MAG: rhodanese-like domain-containing protein [Euzebya sp.]
MSHAGDLTPQQAFDLLESDPTAVLVDVRTAAEWTYVGMPDLEDLDKHVIGIEWNHLDGSRNDTFIQQLQGEGVPPDAPVLFLCRSGARSAAAADAATSQGYTRAHNIAGGFEGDLDPHRHRGAGNGWKATGLPWRQT